MKLLRAVDFWLRIAATGVLLVSTVLWLGLFFLFTRNVRFVRRTFTRALASVCTLARIRVTTKDAHHLDNAGACVVVMNQQSLLCYPVLANVFLRVEDAVVIARMTDEWDLPVVQWLFRATGNINVDSSDPIRSGIGIRDALAALRRGTTAFIFPEGTRWKVPGELGPFKRGAFKLAIEAGVPIVPIVVSPLRPDTDLGAWRLNPNHVEVVILPAIATVGMSKSDLMHLRGETAARMGVVLSELATRRSVDRVPTA